MRLSTLYPTAPRPFIICFLPYCYNYLQVINENYAQRKQSFIELDVVLVTIGVQRSRKQRRLKVIMMKKI